MTIRGKYNWSEKALAYLNEVGSTTAQAVMDALIARYPTQAPTRPDAIIHSTLTNLACQGYLDVERCPGPKKRRQDVYTLNDAGRARLAALTEKAA